MKKQLLALFSLMVMANGIIAMEMEKTFSYKIYGFNVPTQSLAVDQTVTITDKPLQGYSPSNLYDDYGAIWARKIGAGLSTATYKVVAIPTFAAATKTRQEIISNMLALASALENNDIPTMISKLQKLPVGPNPAIENLIKYSEIGEILNKALASADPATQAAFHAALILASVKDSIKRNYPSLSEKEISQLSLSELVDMGPKDLPALKWLLEEEKVKDSGKALERAIAFRFYEAAELLVLNGSKITESAKRRANDNAINPPVDDRYEKLLQEFASFEQ